MQAMVSGRQRDAHVIARDHPSWRLLRRDSELTERAWTGQVSACLCLRVLLSLVLTGCGAGALHPRIQPDGLHSARGQFVVEYALPNTRALTRGSWLLDNFTGSPEGPAARTGPDYQTYAYVDNDGDGRPELDIPIDLYDVRLLSPRTGTVLWLRSVPVPNSLDSRGLDHLALDYAEAVTGGSYYSASFGTVVRERRYATEVTRQGQCTWDGLPAFAIEFTVRNVDRAVIGVTQPEYLVVIVLAHTPSRWRQGSRSFPSVLIAGLAGRPADVGGSISALRELLGGVRIRDERLEARPRGQTSCPVLAETAPAR